MLSFDALPVASNDPLTDEQLLCYRRMLRYAVQDIEFMDDQISRSIRPSQAVLHMRRRLDVRINTLRVLVSPQKRLPPEILSQIFQLCTEQKTVYIPINQHSFPWIFGRVCSRWRDIALSTPKLWSSVTIKKGHYDTSRIIKEATPEIMSRSGGVPTTLTIVAMHRHNPLHALNIHGWPLPWSQLAELRKKTPTMMTSALLVITKATNLVRLSLVLSPLDLSNVDAANTITLDQLEAFDLDLSSCSSEKMQSFFPRLLFPSLQRLSISGPSDVLPTETLVAFFDRSACPIHHFRTTAIISHYEPLLQSLPKLITFIHAPSLLTPQYPIPRALLAKIRDSEFVPNLERFSFLAEVKDLEMLVTVIRRRWLGARVALTRSRFEEHVIFLEVTPSDSHPQDAVEWEASLREVLLMD